jgi:DNA polymerase III epsilon subunit-like protein
MTEQTNTAQQHGEMGTTLERFVKMAQRRNYLILDTETTGLHDGEIVQISIVNPDGDALLNTLVKPVLPIPADATRIHGITDAHVADAPGWAAIALLVQDIIADHDVIVYNAVYDRKMMYRSGELCGIEYIKWKDVARWYCAMEAYAEFWGDWNSYRSSYTWQRLTAACYQQNIAVTEAHSALGDCLMTRALVEKMSRKHASGGLTWSDAPDF